MSTENKSDYLLLFRSDEWHKNLAPQQLEAVMRKFGAWHESLVAKGVLKSAAPLKREGKLISGKGGRTVADGPFAESKETIGGFFLITAGSFEEALAVARSAPMLDQDITIELRPVAEECPCMEQLRAASTQEEHALAGVGV